MGLLHHVEVATVGAQLLAKVQVAQRAAVHHVEQIAHAPVVEMEDVFFFVDCDHSGLLLVV